MKTDLHQPEKQLAIHLELSEVRDLHKLFAGLSVSAIEKATMRKFEHGGQEVVHLVSEINEGLVAFMEHMD